MSRLRFLADHLLAWRRLSALVDGELEPAERERVERHVEECAECGRTARALRWLVSHLRGVGTDRRSGLAARVVRRVPSE